MNAEEIRTRHELERFAVELKRLLEGKGDTFPEGQRIACVKFITEDGQHTTFRLERPVESAILEKPSPPETSGVA